MEENISIWLINLNQSIKPPTDHYGWIPFYGATTKIFYTLDLMLKGVLDQTTQEFLTTELNLLVQREQEWNAKLLENEDIQKKWKQIDDKLNQIHEKCQHVRNNMSDPNYIPSYQEKRELLEFFNVKAIIWTVDHKERFKIQSNPLDIVSTLS